MYRVVLSMKTTLYALIYFHNILIIFLVFALHLFTDKFEQTREPTFQKICVRSPDSVVQ